MFGQKTFTIFSAVLASIVFSLFCCAYYYDFFSRPLKAHKVAVLTFDAAFFNQVNAGIKDALAQFGGAHYDIQFFYGQGLDKLLFQSIVEEAFMAEPDLIVPIGVTFSQLTINMAHKRNSKIPIVFAGPGKPAEQGLVSSLVQRLEPVTGVALSPLDILEPARLFLHCKPSMKNILLPYNPSAAGGALENTVHQVAKFFQDHGVATQSLPIYTISDTKECIAPFMAKVDSLLCFEGDSIDGVNDMLVKLCEQHRVTLFAKDLECVAQGAALGYGVYAYEIGTMAMSYVHRILERHENPGDLPVYFIDGVRRLAFNKTTAASQGLALTPTLLAAVAEKYE